jgi:hypothetical protein
MCVLSVVLSDGLRVFYLWFHLPVSVCVVGVLGANAILGVSLAVCKAGAAKKVSTR